MKKFVLAAAALAALSAPAAAAGLLTDSGMMAPTSMADDWTGFYAGVVAGYGFGTSTYNFAGTTTDVGTSGFIGGVTGGYNQQFQQFVLGGEADLAWSGVTGTKTLTGGSATSTIGWQSTVRGRAGVVFDPVPVMVYGTAGLALGGVSTSITGGTKSYSATQAGWTAGVGVEGKVADQMTIKFEYAYTDLGTDNIPANAFGVTSPAATNHVTEQSLKLGANWHF